MSDTPGANPNQPANPGQSAQPAQPSTDGSNVDPMFQQSQMTQREPVEPVEPAQAPAAAQAPVEAAPPEEEAPPTDEPTPTDIVGMVGQELMDDPASRIAAQQLQYLCGDIDVQRAFGSAYEHSDTTRIDMPYLTEKLGADKAKQVLETAEFLMGYAETVAQRLEQDFYNSVEGGAEGLQQSTAIFNQVADAETKAMVADMLDSGNLNYMRHAARIIQQTAAGSGGQYKHVPLPTFGGAQQAPLTKAEYIQAIQNPNLTAQEYDELRTRYAASRR